METYDFLVTMVTYLAATRSGEPAKPIEKLWRRVHHASDFSLSSTLLFECLAAIAAIKLLSNPPKNYIKHQSDKLIELPDNKTP